MLQGRADALAEPPERTSNGRARSPRHGGLDQPRPAQFVENITKTGASVRAFISGAASRDASDDELIARIARSDPAAMQILYLRHRVRIFKFLRRQVRSRETAEDLVSQVFLDVWRSAGAFEHRSRVSTWLLSIARFKALGLLRQRMHERIDDVALPEIVDASDSPEATVDRTRTNAMLRSCIGKLCPAQRTVIDLVYYHERSVAEVGEILGIPSGTVKTRMFNARKRLATLLDDAGIDAVPANFAEMRAPSMTCTTDD